MATSIELPFSDPTVRALVSAAFEGASTRRTVRVTATTSYHVADYWDGGSRTYVAFVELATMHVVPGSALPDAARQRAANPHRLAIADIELTPGFAAVEHVFFQGKDLGYRVLLHPSNFAPLLTAAPAAPALTMRDVAILNAYATLKSGPYRREALARAEATDGAIASLVQQGLLKRASNGATAITVEGRAALAAARS
jgi:hypothetical protein